MQSDNDVVDVPAQDHAVAEPAAGVAATDAHVTLIYDGLPR